MATTDGRHLEIWNDGTGATGYDSTIAVDDDQWHHVVMTYQSGVANGATMYLDGASVITGTINVGSQANPLMLGVWRDPNGAFSEYFKGTLDEVAIYNTVLTPSTVLQHYKAR